MEDGKEEQEEDDDALNYKECKSNFSFWWFFALISAFCLYLLNASTDTWLCRW